ncbi:MAG TPA: hypothetical protein VJL61_13040 [Rhodanobacteraceae bacterium]|nr:hypothetical protein [Rhodanobacteraceae bacterium]
MSAIILDRGIVGWDRNMQHDGTQAQHGLPALTSHHARAIIPDRGIVGWDRNVQHDGTRTPERASCPAFHNSRFD